MKKQTKKKEQYRILAMKAKDVQNHSEDSIKLECIKCRENVLISPETQHLVKEKNAQPLCRDCFFTGNMEGEFQRPTVRQIQEIRKEIPNFGEKEIKESLETLELMRSIHQIENWGKKRGNEHGSKKTRL